MSENQVRELFAGHDTGAEPPLPAGFADVSLDRARRRSRHRRRSRLVAGAAGLTAVAALAVAGGLAVTTDRPTTPAATGRHGTSQAAPGTAAALLGRVSLAADEQQVTVRDDQFIYIDSTVAYTAYTETDGTTRGQLETPHRRQIWLSVDDSRPGLLREGKSIALDPSGTPPDIRTPTYRYMTTLPTDPDQLLAAIRAADQPDAAAAARKGATLDDLVFGTLGNLIWENLLPPKLAVAVYRAAAKVPGITLVPDLTDAAGRHGVAVARTDGSGVRSAWIFNPKTYEYLGEREINVKDGSTHALTAVLSRGVVDKVGQLPR
jgi:hypothetical protein